MGKIIKDTIHAAGVDIGIYTQDFENEFISLTDIARYKSDDPTAVIQNWMRNRDVIEFLGLWERLHNPDFKPLEFEGFRKQAGANAFTMSPKDKTKVMSQWGTYLRKWLMYVACWRFSKSYDSILQGTFEYDMFYDNNHSLTVRLLKKAMSEFVFDSRVITEPEISAQIILDFLLDRFVPALVRFDNYGIMTAQDKKIITLLSSNYIDDYFKAKEVDGITNEAELLYRRILIATDFISGMTDGYAKMLYKKMSGLE